jgi:hypothetical protein
MGGFTAPDCGRSDAALDAALRAQPAAAAVRVNGSALAAGRTYLITAQGVTRLGLYTDVAVLALAAAAGPATAVRFDLPPSPVARSRVGQVRIQLMSEYS